MYSSILFMLGDAMLGDRSTLFMLDNAMFNDRSTLFMLSNAMLDDCPALFVLNNALLRDEQQRLEEMRYAVSTRSSIAEAEMGRREGLSAEEME